MDTCSCTAPMNGTTGFRTKSFKNSSAKTKPGSTAQDKVKPGRALERTGVTVSGKNGRFVMDGPFAESKEAIAGYLVVDVETIEEAIAIAQSSPNLAYGGSIEVRPMADECPLDVRARELAREEQLVNV